jgi:hypothetical protein
LTLILNGTDNSATTPAVTGTDTDTGVYYPAANQVALATNGTQAVLVNATQGVQFNAGISVGGTAPSTNGTGVKFPATAIAASDANTLDDYEEGTWTPVATASGGSVGAYVTQVGTYTKVGNIVRAYVSMQVTKGTATGNLTISGLPFALSGEQRGLGSVDWFVPSGTAILNCVMFSSNGSTALRACPLTAASVDATSVDFQWSYVSSNVTLSCSFVYQV